MNRVKVEDTQIYSDVDQSEKAKAFEVERFSEWPEHDTIDVSAQVWM